MDKMLQEILEMPEKATEIMRNPSSARLPLHVPYIGMGSSYFAPLAFKYMGVPIYPEIASEYYHYVSTSKLPLAAILSQSGRSSEALWCTSLFEKYIAISNYSDSQLCNENNVSEVIALQAGDEQYSSSKTYINTLLVLFKGFSLDPAKAIDVLNRNMKVYQTKGELLANVVFDILQREKIHGLYITGSGPNIATALQAALILSESTKLTFQGLPMAQYDHGPKETANNSIVIQIVAKGKAYERSMKLSSTIQAAGAHVLSVEEPEVEENFSVINNMIPFNFMAYYLSKKLKVSDTFLVGGKVTEVK